MNTGENIKRLRREYGVKSMTQRELARKIGAWQQNVSEWERNKAAPTYEQAWKMAALFQVPISEICDEYPDKPCQIIPDDGKAVVTTDIALDYIEWSQKQGDQSIKATIISMACLVVSFIVCELAQYGIPSFVILVSYLAAMTATLIFARKIGLKKENPTFSVIESSEFRLDSEAEEMVRQRKTQIKESVQATGNIGTCGLLILLLWFFDKAYDAGWEFSNQMIIFYLIGFGLVVALTLPTMNYWRSIRKLLHETGPQITTPFEKSFWRK